MGYKAGMTHVVRDLDRPGSKMHKKEVVESVTVVETPPIVVVGLAGYIRTPRGLRCLSTVWAEHLGEEFKRAFYKNWYRSKKKAFTKLAKKSADEKQKVYINKRLERIIKYAEIIRVIVHTQVRKLRLGQKKGHVMEIQINGGTTAQKVDFGKGLFEKNVAIDAVFKTSDLVDTIAVTKGHGFEGVTHRWGTSRLPRKTHKGLRKVACIGPWHPARVSYTIPRAGQNGFHHRTEINKKIYLVGKSTAEKKDNAACEADHTEGKEITPMGGFPHYGRVDNDFIIIRGSIPGTVKRCVAIRKPLRDPGTRKANEDITLKFIDTSSKLGRGRFQTSTEKARFLGVTKKNTPKEPKEGKEAKE
jgi:large subunit ribosomal protein L3e